MLGLCSVELRRPQQIVTANGLLIGCAATLSPCHIHNAPRLMTTASEQRNSVICNEKDGSRNFGATLLPFEGTYENAQDEVVVLFQKGPHNASPDLSQEWKNAYHYLFLESQDEIETLVGYLKTNEANGEKFVYLSFSGDFFGRSEIPNLIAVDLSGFSNGFAALQTACAAPR